MTHFAGLLLSLCALAALVALAANRQPPSAYRMRQLISFSVYGASMVLLYGASSYYHFFHISERHRSIARQVDHAMIYLLIAGTYTPLCLAALSITSPVWGYALLGIIWALALTGIALRLISPSAPRALYTSFYIAMGWLVLIAFVPLVNSPLPREGLWWLVGGGVLYTLGGVGYALKWPPLTGRWFGFHELFHLFILAGSFCHFMLMLRGVLPIG